MNRIAEFFRQKGEVHVGVGRAELSSALRAGGATTPYVISITGRCGSTWLACMLADTGLCGSPQEYFSEDALEYYYDKLGASSFGDYISRVVATYSSNERFGFKINPDRFFALAEILELDQFSRSCVWIDMRRRNFVKQSFSMARAQLSGVWHRSADASGFGAIFQADVPPVQRARAIDAQRLEELVWEKIYNTLEQEQRMDAYYAANGLDPLRLYYEDLLESKVFVIGQVLSALGLPDSALDPSSVPQDRTTKMAVPADSLAEIDFYLRNRRALDEMLFHRVPPDRSK